MSTFDLALRFALAIVVAILAGCALSAFLMLALTRLFG